MRRVTAAALVALGIATGAVAGCGGDDTTEAEVPATPPELGIPHDRNAGGSLDAGDDGGDDPTQTTTDPSVTIETTGDDTGSSSPSTSSGGATGGSTGGDTGGAPATQQPKPSATTPPSQTGGSQAPGTGGNQQGGGAPDPGGANGNDFDQFCDQNPGAC